MRKLLIGSSLVAALVGAPALAANAPALRVGDRVGELKGAHEDYLAKPIVVAIAFTTLAITVAVWNEDRHDDDDAPVSA